MIVQGLLTAAVLALLGWGCLPPYPLLAGSLSLGLLSAWGSRFKRIIGVWPMASSTLL